MVAGQAETMPSKVSWEECSPSTLKVSDTQSRCDSIRSVAPNLCGGALYSDLLPRCVKERPEVFRQQETCKSKE